MVNELWDFEKNNVDPKTVDCESTQKYWWKNNHGVSFELAPFIFLKPDTQTSFPEQAIFYHIKKCFNDAINKARYITQYGEIVEIDIFIPSLNVGIEYDGLFWHKDKQYADEAKNQSLNNDGVYVIRIREEGLPLTCDFNGKIIIRENPSDRRTLIDCINDVVDILSRHFGIYINSLSYLDFYKLEDHIIKDAEKPFIEDTCLRSFWDRKKNGELINQYIRLNSTIKYYFSCRSGKTFELSPLQIYTAVKKHQQSFGFCYGNNCLELCKHKKKCCPFKISKICPIWRDCDINDSSKKTIYVQQSLPDCKNKKHESVLKNERDEKTLLRHINETHNEFDSHREGYAKIEQFELKGLCKYCGGAFKKKYFILGDSICAKCGKKKDY